MVFFCVEVFFYSLFIFIEGNIYLELIYNVVGVDVDLVKYYFVLFLKLLWVIDLGFGYLLFLF